MAYPSFHKEIDVCFFFFFCFTVLTETSLGTGFSLAQNMNTQQILMIPSTSELKIF